MKLFSSAILLGRVGTVATMLYHRGPDLEFTLRIGVQELNSDRVSSAV